MTSAGEQLIQEGIRRSKAEGKAEGVLAVLEARGLAVSAEQRARIVGCADVSTLDGWLRRAVTCASVDALFGH